jgi:hypothetical protein
MKKLAALTLVVMAGFTQGDELDIAHRYQQALENRHDKSQTIEQMEGILADASNTHPLFDTIYRTYLDIKGISTNVELNRGVAFATGIKVETFCRGIGLVKSDISHNDGAKTKLRLVGGRFDFNTEKYSVMNKGHRKYELTNPYHDIDKSEVWINISNAKKFDILELRKSKRGTEKGEWFGSKLPERFSVSIAQKSYSHEPVHSYFAMDYQLFGTPDMGYEIEFIEGKTQQLGHAIGATGKNRILLNSVRTVKSSVDEVRLSDADGGRYVYKDCFEVETTIHFAGIESEAQLAKALNE